MHGAKPHVILCTLVKGDDKIRREKNNNKKLYRIFLNSF